MRVRVASLLALAMASPALAQQGLPPAPYAYQQLEDPRLEARARELMHELRCLVCQGQSIADSDAPMAGDMRSQVRSRIAAGQSPDAIRTWLVERYGAWVTYDPPFATSTAILWLMPFVAFLGGAWLTVGRLRARGNPDDLEGAA
jgi:cytochrome c-type biogenesis protein CcmH